jgi:hypothetical protein
MTTLTADHVIAEIARRRTAPHLLSGAAGVDRRVLEAAIDDELAAMTGEDYGRLGGLVGLGARSGGSRSIGDAAG